jgi:enoyl-CoA hydratase/carnithine racemase
MADRVGPPGEPSGIETDALEVTRPRAGVALVRIVSEPLGAQRNGVRRALRACLTDLEASPDVRCLVLTGSGRAFSVGSDIREFRQDAGWLLEAQQIEQDLCLALMDSRLPVIAACNGHTLGGGLVLACACDIRIAASSARFGVPEIKVGAFASGSGTQLLPRLIGRGPAMMLLLSGEIIDADMALRRGLVEEVVPDDDLLDRALDLASAIAAQPAAAVTASKRCVTVGLRDGMAAGLLLEAELSVALGLSDDAAEGQRAFMEKRHPRFSSLRALDSTMDADQFGKGAS